MTKTLEKDLVVLGAGPGGYSAAFRAADLGREVSLVDKRATLGGVCLNEGCIPSKALLHATRILRDAQSSSQHTGISFGKAKVDTVQLRQYTEGVIEQLVGGLAQIARRRKVAFCQGSASLQDANTLSITRADGDTEQWRFKQLIIATGSSAIELPDWPEDKRIWGPADALEVPELPKHLLMVGGGIIGLEMATVYNNLGCEVSVIELAGQIAGNCDPQAARLMHEILSKRGVSLHTGTQVTELHCHKHKIKVHCSGKFDGVINASHVLQCIGRRANTASLSLEKAGVETDARGLIPVDGSGRSNVAHIYAIGDVTGDPMLAHRAVHQAKIAAAACCGLEAGELGALVPSVAYTQPEMAWTGLNEDDARARGINCKASTFPWAANGRTLAHGGEAVGFSKLLYDTATQRIIGATLVGDEAGELIAEITLAIEMGATLFDLAHTIHPHPTRSETLAMSAELALGLCTDL